MITCEFEDKNKAELRHVTVDAIISSQSGDEVLLVKRAPGMFQGNKWSMPGGFLNRGESLEEGILREVKEETGYNARIKNVFQIVSHPDRKGEDRQNVDFVFLVEVMEKSGNSDHEVSEVKWFKLSALPRENDFAFDHFESIELYKKHLSEPFNLPLLN